MQIIDEEEVPEDAVVRAEYEDGTELRTEPAQSREPLVSGVVLRYFEIPSDRTYWVVTPDGETFEFGENDRSSNRNRSGALAALWTRAEGFEITDDPSLIPVDIAVMGKPAIATYLRTVQEVDKSSVAETLEITQGTVEQYVSKFRRGHR